MKKSVTVCTAHAGVRSPQDFHVQSSICSQFVGTTSRTSLYRVDSTVSDKCFWLIRSCPSNSQSGEECSCCNLKQSFKSYIFPRTWGIYTTSFWVFVKPLRVVPAPCNIITGRKSLYILVYAVWLYGRRVVYSDEVHPGRKIFPPHGARSFRFSTSRQEKRCCSGHVSPPFQYCQRKSLF
jgi:hypothetical protein